MSGEAVNGVAGLGRWLAVTSREDVTFWTLPEKKGEKVFRAVFPHGAHDVITTAGGSFIAPLGRTGIMTIKPPFGEGLSVTVSGGGKEGLNFYRIISLRSGNGQEALAFRNEKGRHRGNGLSVGPGIAQCKHGHLR